MDTDGLSSHIVAYPAALPKSLALAECCFCKSQSDELKTEEQERMTGDSTDVVFSHRIA